MILGLGTDIVEIFRMREAAQKWGDGFLEKVFTDKEMRYSNSRRFSAQHFAARFAAKEAVIKAFGAPKKFPLKMTEIEVLNDKEGKPVITLHGGALRLKKKKKVDNIMVTMAHSKNYAVASAILLGGKI